MSDNLHPNWSVKTQATDNVATLSNQPVLAGKQLSRRPAAVFGIVIALIAGYWLYGFAETPSSLPAQVVPESETASSSISSVVSAETNGLPAGNSVPVMMQSGIASSSATMPNADQIHSGAPLMQYQTTTAVVGKGKGTTVVTTPPPVQPQSGPGAWVAALISFVAVYKTFMVLQRKRTVYS